MTIANPWTPIDDDTPHETFVLTARDSGYVTTPWRFESAIWSEDKQRWNDVTGDALEPQPKYWMESPITPDDTSYRDEQGLWRCRRHHAGLIMGKCPHCEGES